VRAVVYWIATSEEEIHYIDGIISAYDGVATVRREFRVRDGQTQYRVYVAPGMEDEFLEIMERLRETAKIDAVIREDDDAPSTAA
jgi:hypothetical protein